MRMPSSIKEILTDKRQMITDTVIKSCAISCVTTLVQLSDQLANAHARMALPSKAIFRKQQNKPYNDK